jgi:glycosyltransferase involved in cell wall biosynthesis
MTGQDRQVTVAHVPMAQGGQGSTLLAVAEGLCEAHARVGGSSRIVLERHLSSDSPTLPIAYGPVRFDARRTRRDLLHGRLGLQRPSFGRVYDPAIEALLEHPPDLVLLYEGHYAAASLPRWKRLQRKGAEVVLYVHNPLSRSYGRRELRRLLGAADRVVFVAQHERDQAIRRLGRYGLHPEVVPNGVDDTFRVPAPRTRPSGDFVVTFVGRLTPQKAPHIAVQAADLARRLTGLPFRVQVIGDSWYGRGGSSPYERWLRSECASIGTPVEFIPFSERAVVAEALRRSSAACFPSTYDTLPLVVLEAMASGLPVVCSDIPGMLETGGEAVLIAGADDIDGMADALATLAEDEELWADRSRMVWERSARFTWDATLRGLLGKGHVPPPR